MRRFLILAIASVLVTSLSAQDLIITSFGDTIRCQIIRMDSISVAFQIVKKDGSREAGMLALQFVTDFRMEQKNVAKQTEIENTENTGNIAITGSKPLIISSGEVTKPKPDYTTFRWAVASGYAKRLSKIPEIKRTSKDYVELFKKLTNCFSWETELQFLLNKRNGLALNVSGVHASVSQSGSVSIPGYTDFYDYKLKQRMIYVGPAWIQLYETKHFLFSSSLSPGVLIFTEKQWPYNSAPEPEKKHSVAGAIHYGIGSECKISSGCAIGLKLGITLDSFSLFNTGDPYFKSQIPVSWSNFVIATYISFRN